MIVPRLDILLGSMPAFWFKISGPFLGFLVAANETLNPTVGALDLGGIFGFGFGDNELPLPSFDASELPENCSLYI